MGLSIPHFIILLLNSVGAVSIFAMKDSDRTYILKYSVLTLLLLHIPLFYGGNLLMESFIFPGSLPLHLCSISFYLTLFALISRHMYISILAILWGLLSSLLALILPDLDTNSIDFRFIEFFISHTGIFLGCIYLIVVEKISISYRQMWYAMGTLCIYALIIYAINIQLSGNFLYLMSSEGLPSIFPQAPYHIPLLITVAFIIFHIEYSIARVYKNYSYRNHTPSLAL